MWRIILVLMAYAALSAAAKANPWPRAEGQTFLSGTGTYRYNSDSGLSETESSLYAEYGLRSALTLGFDAQDATRGTSHVIAFLRWPIGKPDHPLKTSFTLGLGGLQELGVWSPAVRLAVSVGQPVSTPRPGWWSLSATLEHQTERSAQTYKLDATYGLNLTDRLTTIFDIETSTRTGLANSVTLRSSLAWKLQSAHHLILGAEAKQAGTRSYGLRLGVWSQF